MAMMVIGTGQAEAAKLPSFLAPLIERKQAIAGDLARQVAFCSRRKDTDHPAFRGCVDWHSSVHGVWALVAYQRATGDRQYGALVNAILEKEALAREREHLRREPLFEMPYGRAWFLRLAIDHRKLTASDTLLPFADEVAMSLRDYYRTTQRLDRFSGAYQSASWAMINLMDYARDRHLADLETEVANRITEAFIDVNHECAADHERGEFMAVCTNWAALVGRILDKDSYSCWLETFIAANGLPKPLTSHCGDHEHGLNFSRAWGLWDMYRGSGRDDVLKAYLDHFEGGVTPASNWRGDYRAVGHWVAQFGMFALQPLFGTEAGR
jgi:Protein of unknown function (DUF2891)